MYAALLPAKDKLALPLPTNAFSVTRIIKPSEDMEPPPPIKRAVCTLPPLPLSATEPGKLLPLESIDTNCNLLLS